MLSSPPYTHKYIRREMDFALAAAAAAHTDLVLVEDIYTHGIK